MKLNKLALAVALALAGTGAQAASFVNGDFETGTEAGWTFGGGLRTDIFNASLDPTTFLAGGSRYNAGIAASHSAVVAAGTLDPNVGAAFGSTTYAGGYSLRVEDTIIGGYASVATQTVLNYTDANIFFAWKSVLEGAHTTRDAATLIIKLTDLTTGDDVITRQYNAASGGGGVDPRFTYHASSGSYYNATWQIEQLAIDASRFGHNFTLSVLVADCELTGHYGYVYLDGFGAVTPPAGVPEPGALSLLGVGMLAMAGAARRRKKS
jgi:hypothetical protein